MTRHTTATTQHTGDRRTPACHYDRNLDTRVIRIRQPDGPDQLERCPNDHCVVCTREHTDHAHPLTCPECIGAVRRDLEDIRWLARHLRWHAARGEGLAVPSARIPGGDALVVLARAGAGWDDLHTRFGPLKDNPKADLLTEDHPADDVMPVLLPLLGWEHQWRTHFGHTRRTTDRSPVTAITRYFEDHLDRMAQTTTGPDWPTFAADMTALRRELEGILHDERDPERGVPCFECGDRLVRRFGDPHPCRHATPARRHLDEVERRAARGRATLTAIATYPELRGREYPSGWTPAELAAARPPSSAEVSAARVPCPACVERGQGGIVNPAVGQSWECLGCRKQYTPGEYAYAVRRHLLTTGPNGDGWTHITMAAEAASTQTGFVITPRIVRNWMDSGKVQSCCRWSTTVDGKRADVPVYDQKLGHATGAARRRAYRAMVVEYAGRVASVRGLILVYWPDVADRAAELVVRHAEVERARRERLVQRDRFWEVLEVKGVRTSTMKGTRAALKLGKSMGIHPNRVRAFLDELEATRRETA